MMNINQLSQKIFTTEAFRPPMGDKMPDGDRPDIFKTPFEPAGKPSGRRPCYPVSQTTREWLAIRIRREGIHARGADPQQLPRPFLTPGCVWAILPWRSRQCFGFRKQDHRSAISVAANLPRGEVPETSSVIHVIRSLSRLDS